MKKIFSIVTVLICLFQLASCGRGAQEANSSTDPKPTSERTASAQYAESYYPFPGDYSVESIARIDNKLLMLGKNEANYILGLADYTESETGRIQISEVEQLSLDLPSSPEEAVVYDITAGGDGFFYILTGTYAENSQNAYAVLKYDSMGNYQERMNIPEWTEKPLRGLNVQSDGKIVLRSSEFITLLPWQGTIINTSQIDGNGILSSTVCDKGVIVSVMTGTMDRSPFYLVDGDSGVLVHLELTNPYEIGSYDFISLYMGSVASCQGLNGEFIINTGDTFQLCDFDSDSCSELLQWNYGESTFGSAGPACRLSDNDYACISSGNVVVTGMEEVPYTEKSVVKVAAVDLENTSVVVEMNNRSQTYDYQIIQYTAEEKDRFLTDLISGNSFDLVLTNDRVNTNSDFFEDLFLYIDNDPDLSRDMFLPNLLESTSTHGQLHQIWDQVNVTTLVTRANLINGRSNLTPADYNEIVTQNDQIQALFDTFMSKRGLLSWLSEVSISAYVDKQNATCHFDDPTFSAMLAWCQSLGGDLTEGVEGSHYDSSEVLLWPYAISRTDYFDDIRNNIGGEIAFVGFPDGGDGFHYYSVPNNTGLTMAIPTNSQNKEGAWAFIKERISLETQLNLNSVEGMPVNYDALKRLAETNAKPEDRELLYDLLNRTKYAKGFADDGLREIIISSGQGYLAGEKTLEETVSLIQSRASIYVAEQYG